MATSRDGSVDDPSRDTRAEYDYRNDSVDRSGLVSDLEALVDGDVRFDEYSKQLYATDASAYEVTPIGVVFPTSTDDVAAVMRYCADREIPVLPRGGGTSLAGQAVNRAVVLDFTKYMDRVLGVEPDARRARAQAGISLGELNRTLEPHGLKFAPDPSTADRSALGGAIGNNTTGAHSLKYGKTDAYVEECEVVLADGSVETVGEIGIDQLRERADPDGESIERIHAEVVRIIDEETEAVEETYPDLKRNVSGYNLDVLVEEAKTGSINLARLLVGSEGTLGIVTEAAVTLEPIPETTAVGLLTYHSLLDAMEDVGTIIEHDPAAIEVLDDVLLDLARQTEEFAGVVGMLPEETNTFLLVEFYADSDDERREKVERLLADRIGDIAFDGMEAYDAEEQATFWKMRKASTPILLSRTTDEKHIAFIEDVAVPPEHLPEYIAEFQEVFEDHDTFGSFYAHAGPGCMHVRPLVNTKTAEGIETMVSISDAATDLAVKYGGSVSGEHGDGRARTQWNRKLYGEDLWETFRDLKTAFDPDWLLNPGSVCGDFDMSENLRFDPDYEFEAGFEPELNWDNDNGFQGMVELCHGCGGCRTSQEGTGGVMCPTYRASEEEITSTRGRANMLRQAMSGDLPEGEQFDTEFMHEVMDLCIGCKGCAKDCPSEVDMAKMKVEVEHEHHQRHGVDLRSRVFANIDRLSDLGTATAPLSNLASAVPGSRLLMEKTLGIARERSLPEFESETLTEWYETRGPRVAEEEAERRVVLFPDTFTDHNNPDAGRAAIRVLEAAGVHVRVPEGVTGSGRPAHSKGLIDKARAKADRNVTALAHYVNDSWDVVVIEPSDAVMFQLDYLDLLSEDSAEQSRGKSEISGSSESSDSPDSADQSSGARFEAEREPRETNGEERPVSGSDPRDAVERVAGNTYGVMEYIDRFRLEERMGIESVDESLTYHGHCHQKATKKDHHAVGVLRRVGYAVDALDSGCCGMAGSFGYEAEHFSMSRAIAEMLFKRIDDSDGETVVAPGSSCRTQIGDGYGEKPPHPIRKLAEALDQSPNAPPSAHSSRVV